MAFVFPRYPAINPVFFIGASAGGVKAFIALASALPDDFPCPVFFLLHRLRDSEVNSPGMLAVLQSKSNLPVKIAEDGEVVRSGCIYLPPENLNIGIDDNQVFYSDLPDDELWRPSINFLFKSGAREYKDRAIAILLTGKLDDGIQGMIETSHQGGITVAQSPSDAYEPHLPLMALMNDHPSHVLPLADIPKLMCEFVHHNHFDNQKDIFEESAKIATSLKDELQ
ncbi:chemotaxis protein CheB [Alteromonas sp. BMJM2]|uniref:chemotaxis protein CheB n=1 Tax=Alteromonas sp. BMJM2 TaxID=2954241 RepID=UPI0022B5C068|nr:chemotaxis protein CheB [Alteromonas sp. BMJM2]